MTSWRIDPEFDPLQELKDLKEAHCHLANCHNELVVLMRELSDQHKILLEHFKSQRRTLRSFTETNQ